MRFTRRPLHFRYFHVAARPLDERCMAMAMTGRLPCGPFGWAILRSSENPGQAGLVRFQATIVAALWALAALRALRYRMKTVYLWRRRWRRDFMGLAIGAVPPGRRRGEGQW